MSSENDSGIKPICAKCKKILKKFGGVLLSPPDENEMVKKLHLCKTCYEIVLIIIEDFK